MNEIWDKNPLKKLVKPRYKFPKSVTETNNKVQKSKTYNKAIFNLIYENKRPKASDKKLENLDSH